MTSIRLIQRKSPPRRRRGVAIVEGAVVVLATLVVLLGMLDLAIAVLRFNSLSEGVRRIARDAIVHGHDAAPESTTWGPEPFNGTADNPSEIAQAIRPALAGIDPGSVAIHVEWIDGGNIRGQRVRVVALHSYQPAVPYVLGAAVVELRAQSIMTIVH